MKNKGTLENINMPSNFISFYPDKKRIIERQNRIKDNDFTNLTKLVKNSVEKINDLFSQADFQKKYKFVKKPSRGLKHGITDIQYDEINKINEISSKERPSSLQKSSKTNFTFNINNFITVPNINPALPNITQVNQEKINNSIEHNKKFDLKNENIKNIKNSYLNITKKSTTSNIKKSHNNENNNFNTLNNSLFQIDEIQPNNSSMNNRLKTNLKMNNNKKKNIKLSIVNSRESKTFYNISSNRISETSKFIKDFDPSTPDNDDNNINNMILSGLSSITQNRRVLYRMAVNNKKKDNNINKNQKIEDDKDAINRPNKYKIKQKENNRINQNKNNVKKNYEVITNKTLKNQDKLSKSKKKLFKTGDNFYSKKHIENTKNDINESISIDDINKKTNDSQPHRRKGKNKNMKERKNKQNTLNKINLKTVNDLNNKKYNKINTRNISDKISSSNSPNHNLDKNQKRGGSIPNERRFKKNDSQYSEFEHNSSTKILKQVINIFYAKEFPSKVNTNEILKLMLLFNEYLINNNLLSDGQKMENKKLLNDYSKYISSIIKVDYPQEQDIVVDPSLKCVKKIQRKWRKRKVEKYMNKHKKNEINELKSMILNKYIQKSGNGVKKIIGLFNTILENFDNINKQPDTNEMFYLLQNLIHNKLTKYEKNLLYKEYINSVILGNNN